MNNVIAWTYPIIAPAADILATIIAHDLTVLDPDKRRSIPKRKRRHDTDRFVSVDEPRVGMNSGDVVVLWDALWL